MSVVQFPHSRNEEAFPAFFEDAPVLRVRDPLAAYLGMGNEGTITYRYADAVRLAGHSCPTVAGAWLMVVQGLAWLYDGEIPERGAIEVHMRDGRTDGAAGVIAAIATLLTGAAPETGFKGIGAGHRFARRDLLVRRADRRDHRIAASGHRDGRNSGYQYCQRSTRSGHGYADAQGGVGSGEHRGVEAIRVALAGPRAPDAGRARRRSQTHPSLWMASVMEHRSLEQERQAEMRRRL